MHTPQTSFVRLLIVTVTALTLFTGTAGVSPAVLAQQRSLSTPPLFTETAGVSPAVLAQQRSLSTPPLFTGTAGVSPAVLAQQRSLSTPPLFTETAGVSPAVLAQHRTFSAPLTPTNSKTVNVPIVYYKLPNGLKVVISEDHMAPVVTVAVYYNIGFRVEPKGRTGFAHLFEHMMFQGSENVKKFEHAKLVEANGGSLNGSTRLDHTNYYQTLPSNRVEMGLWLESDRMRSLDVSAENLKNQQNVVSEEGRVNVLNQPYAAFEWLDLWMNANQNWFNAHNFYGDLTEIEAATLDDVRNL